VVDQKDHCHQDFKHKITKIIVVNVGVVEDDLLPVIVVNEDDAESPDFELGRLKENEVRWVPLAQGIQLMAKAKIPNPYLQPYLDCRICSPKR
jgi:hypothetical protein